jgi:hypothetical protein
MEPLLAMGYCLEKHRIGEAKVMSLTLQDVRLGIIRRNSYGFEHLQELIMARHEFNGLGMDTIKVRTAYKVRDELFHIASEARDRRKKRRVHMTK